MQVAEVTECDRFTAGSRLWKICRGESGLPIDKANKYRSYWGLEPLPGEQENTLTAIEFSGVSVKRSRDGLKYTTRVTMYGPGSELLHAYAAAKVPDCDECFELAMKMNRWGVDGCRDNLDTIIADMLPRAKDWVAENKPWVHALLPGVVEDIGIVARLKSDVTKAIERAEAVRKHGRPEPAEVISSVQSKLIGKRKSGCSSCGGKRKTGKTNTPHYSRTIHATAVNVFTPKIDVPMVQIVTAIRTSHREKPTLQSTIDSMRTGGFQPPIVFAEPNAPERKGNRVFASQLLPFKSFATAAKHLVAEFPTDWILLCEDDVEFRDGAADFLREANITTNQIVSLYSAVVQTKGIMPAGFSHVTGDMWGSLAYLIHADTLRKIIDSQTFQTWPKPDRVDRAFCKAASEIGAELVFHTPALAQHTGATSTIAKHRTLTRGRTSVFDSDRHESPLVALITPTGDRHDAFERCKKWVKNQRYTGPMEWIVVDDGSDQVTVPGHVKYIREKPQPNHSLCRNLLSAIPHVSGGVILIIEDDDYYGPDYVSTMVGRLRHADLVGEFGAKYYYLLDRRWRHKTTENHASLCRTGMTRAVLDTLRDVVTGTDHPSVDLRLWDKWQGSRISWIDEIGTSRMCVGIKQGSTGRQSHGWRSTKLHASDADGAQLHRWLGPDAHEYQQ